MDLALDGDLRSTQYTSSIYFWLADMMAQVASVCYCAVAVIDLTCSSACQELEKRPCDCHTCRCFSNNLLRVFYSLVVLTSSALATVGLVFLGSDPDEGACPTLADECPTTLCCCGLPTGDVCISQIRCTAAFGVCTAPFTYSSAASASVVVGGIAFALNTAAWCVMASHSRQLRMSYLPVQLRENRR